MEPISNHPIIHLSYHMGQHYNSVRRGDDPCIKGESQVGKYPIGHEIEKVKEIVKQGVVKQEDIKKSKTTDFIKLSDNVVGHAM